jgi:hypothetical protein
MGIGGQPTVFPGVYVQEAGLRKRRIGWVRKISPLLGFDSRTFQPALSR